MSLAVHHREATAVAGARRSGGGWLGGGWGAVAWPAPIKRRSFVMLGLGFIAQAVLAVLLLGLLLVVLLGVLADSLGH